MDADTDFEEVAARARTHSEEAPGSDTERVTIRSFDDLDPDSLSELIRDAEEDAPEPGSLVVVLSEANAELLLEREGVGEDVTDLEAELGREVRVEGEMPDDTVLVLDPDAIEGEEIEEPEGVTCGIFGSGEG